MRVGGKQLTINFISPSLIVVLQILLEHLEITLRFRYRFSLFVAVVFGSLSTCINIFPYVLTLTLLVTTEYTLHEFLLC